MHHVPSGLLSLDTGNRRPVASETIRRMLAGFPRPHSAPRYAHSCTANTEAGEQTCLLNIISFNHRLNLKPLNADRKQI